MQQYKYYDYAAATPISDTVKQAMLPYFSELFYNPSALYQPARSIRKRIDQARQTVAKQAGVLSSGVYFTAGITEANNLLLHSLAQVYDKPRFIISAIEHESISKPAELLAHKGLIDLKVADVDDQGRVDMAKLKDMIDRNTVLISIILVNNETGVIQDLTELKHHSERIEAERKRADNDLPLLIHSDAAQAPGVMSLQLSKLGLDMASISAAKLYGPKQAAALLCARPVEMAPLIAGGTQERGVRAGTENAANIMGLEAALKETAAMRSEQYQHLEKIQHLFESQLLDLYPGTIIHSGEARRAPHISNVVIPGVNDGERLVMELDERGYLAATGSACTAGDGEPSSIIVAMSKNQQQAAASLRLSFGRHTTTESISGLLRTLNEILNDGLV